MRGGLGENANLSRENAFKVSRSIVFVHFALAQFQHVVQRIADNLQIGSQLDLKFYIVKELRGYLLAERWARISAKWNVEIDENTEIKEK